MFKSAYFGKTVNIDDTSVTKKLKSVDTGTQALVHFGALATAVPQLTSMTVSSISSTIKSAAQNNAQSLYSLFFPANAGALAGAATSEKVIVKGPWVSDNAMKNVYFINAVLQVPYMLISSASGVLHFLFALRNF